LDESALLVNKTRTQLLLLKANDLEADSKVWEIFRELPALIQRHGLLASVAYLGEGTREKDVAYSLWMGARCFSSPTLLLSTDSERKTPKTACDFLMKCSALDYQFWSAIFAESAEILASVASVRINGEVVSTALRGQTLEGSVASTRYLVQEEMTADAIGWSLQHGYSQVKICSEAKENAETQWLQCFASYAVASNSQVEQAREYERELATIGFKKIGEMSLVDRVFLGMSNSSVWGAWITLDPLSGLPRINGEGIKGAVRATAERLAISTPSNISQGWIDLVFGSENAKQPGYVEWADAPWSGSPGDRFLVFDTRTPHEHDHHESGGERPANGYSDPTPIPALAAAGGFNFFVRLSPRVISFGWTNEQQEKLLLACRTLARLTFQTSGIGGRTNSGSNGRFKP
jgi:CRISPR type III-B/RAMP module RAMP protein Cmr6